jgi:hypothetical protein
MVKVTGPAMSLDAQKTIGNTLTYQRRPSGHSVYLKAHPGSVSPTPVSAAQAARRVFVSEAIAAWNALSPAEKQEWNEYIFPST